MLVDAFRTWEGPQQEGGAGKHIQKKRLLIACLHGIYGKAGWEGQRGGLQQAGGPRGCVPHVRGASKATDSKEHIIEHCAAKARAKCAMPRNGYGCNVRDRGMFVAAMSSTRMFLRSIRFSQHAAAFAIE